MQVVKAPSKNYRFNPKYNDVVVRFGKRGWTVKAETLTDVQAKYMLNAGSYGHLIKTIEEAEEIAANSGKVVVEKPFADMKISELKDYLHEKGVDDTDCKLKADYVALAEKTV